MKRLAVGCLLIIAASAVADHKIVGDTKIPIYSFASLRVDTTAAVSWKVYPAPIKKEVHNKVLIFTGKPGVQYLVWATVVDFDAKTFDEAEAVVTFGGGPGPEPGPTPPVPPDPKPPDPPTPKPIPANGFHVLIVYETAEIAKLPSAQVSALYAKSVREYLDSKCVAGPDGKTKQWRVWDKDIDLVGESQLWRVAMARKRDAMPWILISSDKGGYEGPLPANTAELLALLKKYGD